MRPDQLAELDRIPTPTEFVAFAASQGWRFELDPDGPKLLAPRHDELAVAFARVLSREPYRTRVVAILWPGGTPRDAPGEPEPPADPDPEPERCRACGKDVSDPETRERLADPLFCDRTRGECPWKR